MKDKKKTYTPKQENVNKLKTFLSKLEKEKKNK